MAMDKIEIMAKAMRPYAQTEGSLEFAKMEAQAALKALSDAGYAVVPKVPTEAMKRAGATFLADGRWQKELCEDAESIYTAMIAAGEGNE
jgi:hypothetical protein